MDPRFTQKTVKFGGGQIMVWGYILYGGVREICRVEGNINSLKYQEVLAASYIPNHKRGQILQQDGAPSHTSISTLRYLWMSGTPRPSHLHCSFTTALCSGPTMVE